MNFRFNRLGHVVVLLLPFVGLSNPLAVGQESGAGESAPPVEMNAQQDHRHMMELLGIASIRPGANGRDSNAPNAANYDESQATLYPSLPDPLLTQKC